MSMRIKATLILAIIVFVITLTSFITNFLFSRQSISEAVDQDLSLAINFADKLISTKMQLIKANGATVAERLLNSTSAKDMTEIMAMEINKFPEFDAFSVIDQNYGVIANFGVPVKSAELLEENRYVQMAYSGESVIPTTHYDLETNEFVMNVFVPISSGMVLVGRISGFTFSNLIRSYRVWQTGSILILDDEGTIIAGQHEEPVLQRLNPMLEAKFYPDDREAQSRKDTVIRILTTDSGTSSFYYGGSENICKYKRITGTTGGWHVLVMAPAKENPGFQVRQDLLFSALFFLAAGLLISIFASQFVVRPFEKIEDQSAKILESHKRTNLLLNAMPLSCHLWNSRYEMFYCNEENLRLFKLENTQEFLSGYEDFSPEYQEDGQLSSEKQKHSLKKAFEEGRDKFEWMHKLKDGSLIPAEVTLVRIPFDNVDVVAAYVRDLREQKNMTAGIVQRDRLLDTVNRVAAILLKSEIDDFKKDLELCMGMIANEINLDRVHIWKRHVKDGVLSLSIIAEWDGDVEPRLYNFYTADSVNEKLPGWLTVLSEGKSINKTTATMSAGEQAVFNPQGVKSIFEVPVFFKDEFWGFIGFDDCHNEKTLTENEQSILSSAGNIIAYAVFQNEMTKSIRSSAARLEAVLNNFSGIIWSVDRDLKITLFQGRYLKKMGNLPPSVEGLTLYQFLDRVVKKTPSKKIYENVLKTFTEGQKEWNVWADKTRLHFSSTPIYDDFGEITDIVGNFNDITELSTLQTELEAALNEAREANKAKSHFLARMSHEMRTPLNAIIGLTGLALEAEGVNKEVYSNLEKVYEAGELLLSTVNDVLDISKIEVGKLELIPNEYNIPSLINDTITQNILRIGEKPVDFVLDIEPSMLTHLYGDEIRIKQLFNNLLSNALKYTKKGKVELIVRCEHEAGTDVVWMTIRVKDTGIGIRPNEIGNLFSDYSQLDKNANHKIEGTGLGLSITKKIAEMMEGSVFVESEYGKGSVFTAKIKQKYVNDSTIGEEVVNNLKKFRYSDQKRKKNSLLVRNKMPYAHVLVVDDVQTNLDVARGILKAYDMRIDCISSGRDAINIIREGEPRYDAVFMDHMMPEMDGIEATRVIREEIGTEYARTVPIIALTANAVVGNEEMFLQKGFQAFISKPIDVIQLDSILNTWIRNRQSEAVLLQAQGENAAGEKAADPMDTLDVLKGVFLESVDLIQGVNRFLNEETYLDAINSYYKHMPALLEKIRSFSADSSGDAAQGISLQEYGLIAHSLKGSSYSISANAAGKGAAELEAAAKAGDIETIRAKHFPFIALVESLLDDLKGILQKAAGGKAPQKEAHAPDPKLLLALTDAVRKYRSSEMEEIIKELESYNYENGSELVEWLRKKMDTLEYDSISERLEAELFTSAET